MNASVCSEIEISETMAMFWECLHLENLHWMQLNNENHYFLLRDRGGTAGAGSGVRRAAAVRAGTGSPAAFLFTSVSGRQTKVGIALRSVSGRHVKVGIGMFSFVVKFINQKERK